MQFAFYNFKTTRLGNAAWYDPDALYRQRQYVQDLLFTAPYRLDSNEGEMPALRRQLRSRGISEVTPWNIEGFDAAWMLLKPVEDGRVGPLDVGEGVSHIDSLNLAAGMQKFHDRQMSGLNMWLMTYKNDHVELENPQERLEALYPPPPPVDSSMMFDPEKLGEELNTGSGE